MTQLTFAAHDFTVADFDAGRLPFEPSDYSRLKFGCDATSKNFGWQVADRFFAEHRELLMRRQAIVVPSAYNFVPNAAMVMAKHMIERLNHLLAAAGGQPVEYSLVRRKLTFTTDYGFLSKEERVDILMQDQMYFNASYARGKTIIFLDDIRITGTNELCMKALLEQEGMLDTHDVVYLYFARLVGGDRPEVEAALNLNSIRTLDEYVALSKTPKHHVIVRPIKFVMSRPVTEFIPYLSSATDDHLLAIYYGAMGEGYYNAPGFVTNFSLLRTFLSERGLIDPIGVEPVAEPLLATA